MTTSQKLAETEAARRLFSRLGYEMKPDADGVKHFEELRDGKTNRIHPRRTLQRTTSGRAA
jgi:hypothetical protein